MPAGKCLDADSGFFEYDIISRSGGHEPCDRGYNIQAPAMIEWEEL